MEEWQRSGEAILRRGEVERETGLSRSSIYKRMRVGRFPRPVSLGGRIVGWRLKDIRAFLADPARYRAEKVVGDPGQEEDGHADK
ncbi:AlpA family transcriptional regulator [Burkholderia sp. WAC0059]|uniref:helix-turn-helix transcriptional regulator n=1 Tax=Burkholderia sp. WAC0059 TaxID=2066022 RepID=UPI000C7E91BA|nr:AlpA family phage regulatory protein [Burkholderia sp. WAC0059]PLZ01778.1 AlpA family transcriptional regulator [Burkholderia sp. WAC0059]